LELRFCIGVLQKSYCQESKSYQKELLLLLPPKIDIPVGRLEVTFEFGMSMASDYEILWHKIGLRRLLPVLICDA
jgi:hypothetical protein